ncbi:glycosyl transferase [Cupriavidus necator]|uniref:Glycosyl transferase n=1 Tax=Cupriavidus necator TaxID=106590 RepID=A0A1U9USP4_CUPNE|nr:glycosyltransferase family 2 protein [Cupriavidus necator]AQV95291.1 glycosyl transferase [Cupriavidus necator]
MLKAGALFVTYLPTSEQVRHISDVASEFDSVVAVDNSPPDSAVDPGSFGPGIKVVLNANQGGIAGAFNRAIEVLLDEGVEHVYFFDQDSLIPHAYRKGMEEALKSAPPACLIGPRIYDVNLRAFSPRYNVSRWHYRADDVSQEDNAVLPCTLLISSGSVATRQALEKCGPFREDYFIDDVDTEYCLRAGTLAVGVYLNTGLVLSHAIGDREEHRFLGMRVRPSHHSALRRYYRSRNGIHLSSRQLVRSPAFFVHNQKRLAHETIGVILYEQRKLKKLVGILIGIFDGLVGRLGDLSRSSPRLYRWLTTK